ncbi:MAG: acyl carrier protein [Lactobacillus sp.]|nr:acyl carrier protein [Lactobacillus sp.]
MTKEVIFKRIRELIADNFEIDESKVTMDTNFKEDLQTDSINLVEFILQLEDEFGAEIPDEEAEKISSVSDAVNYIAAHAQHAE